MVQQNIVAYILSQFKQGRKLEDINKFLLEAGYERSEVESSVQYVINLQTNPKIAEEQRIQQLAEYIQKQLRVGYDQQTITNFLISRGYPYYEVNSALQQSTLPKKEIKIEHKLIVFALIAMFVMTSTITIIYLKSYTHIGIGVPEQLLDVETEKLTILVQQGGDLTFQVKLINFGYEKRFDVILNYKIIDRETQTTILEKSETVALSTTLENIVKFAIPETMKTGKYVLRVDAVYNKFTATSGFVFDILPKEIAEEKLEEIREQLPEIENITEIPELAPETPPKTQEEIPEPIPAPPKPEEKFYKGKTRQQAFEMVKAVSVREPQRAIEMCQEFRLSANTYSCIIKLAEFRENPIFCESIEDNRQKDNCYVQLAITTGDETACAQITNPSIKQSCQMAAFSNNLHESPQPPDPDVLKEKMAMFGVQVNPE